MEIHIVHGFGNIHVLYGKLSVDNISLLFFFIKFPLCGLGDPIITLSHSFFSHSWLRSKKEQEIVFIKAFTYFETLEDKNIFLNKWKNSINSFDVSKEKMNVV